MAHVKMDDDLVILIEAIESNGVTVDTLMIRHIWQIDARLKDCNISNGSNEPDFNIDTPKVVMVVEG